VACPLMMGVFNAYAAKRTLSVGCILEMARRCLLGIFGNVP
jgi:hypothetical protein